MVRKILALSLFLVALFYISQVTVIDAASSIPVGGSETSTGTDEPCPGNKCDTAIGPIDVSSPVSIIMRIFSIALSLGSTAALIIIIYSGYRLLSSRGNKEILQGARETLTSAIVGLLFMVFSLVILSVVAGDIIKIPGFN